MEGPPEGKAPAAALAAVLKHSSALPSESSQVRGYDFNRGVDYRALLEAFGTTGFQATNFGRAVQQVNAMIEKKLEPLSQDEDHHADLTKSRRPLTGCTIFLGYTSNLISSGIRETIRYLVQHNMVDVLVTTAGGVEEDFIKCLAPTYLGDFSLRGKELRENGINRIGNLLVPNDNYCKFEDWLMPILDQMVLEQNTEGVKWTPSKMIARLGKEINNPESVYYWAQKNHIPVLSPALTDGSLGDMIFFHSYKNPGLVLDIVEDLRLINTQAVFAKRTGMIILGGGLVKHHIANANLMVSEDRVPGRTKLSLGARSGWTHSLSRSMPTPPWSSPCLWLKPLPRREMPSCLRRMRTEWLRPREVSSRLYLLACTPGPSLLLGQLCVWNKWSP
ncbi:deoxyhypusine synthase isoform X3 [Ursus maritimus]|uniref:Deoxyhypusine synthase n=2 Tax=Ursus maritimus TaxID=29073 RepID=A0A8M1FSW7_URSMA|nr:deoxyhypusine synthase isoform X3 [Ursus maritimus]XP_044235947.1 deoxyhypusine synthase isoform X4 [Ursus arctos]